MTSLRDICSAYQLPLGREEFALALRHGLGRAYLHAQQFGAGDYRDLILAACFENQAYDRQIESDRIHWTYRLLDDSLKAELLDRLLDESQKTEDDHSLSQMAKLCLLLYRDGHTRVSSILRQMFRPMEYSLPLGSSQIVEIEGAEGLVWVAQRMLELSVPDEIGDQLSRLTESYCLPFEPVEARRILAQYPEIAVHLPPERKSQGTPVKRRVKTQRVLTSNRSVTEIIDLLRNSTGGIVREAENFVQKAAKPELTELVEAFNGEVNPSSLVSFLKLFRRVDYPLSPGHLLKLAQHSDEKVRWDAFGALARVRHPKVRALALASLQNRQWDQGQMALLGPNFETADAEILNRCLRFDGDPYLHHVLVCNLVELIEEHACPELLEVMIFAYQTAYCGYCRVRAYEAMKLIGQVPDWIEQEFEFDYCQLELKG